MDDRESFLIMGDSKKARAPKGTRTVQVSRRLAVVVLESAKRDGKKFLNDGQYFHMVGVIQRLVDFNNSDEISDLRIEPIENFFELKEKGGLLGKINVRIYFAHLQDEGRIVVLKAYKKDEDGQVSRHVVITVQARLRAYIQDGPSDGATIYQADLIC